VAPQDGVYWLEMSVGIPANKTCTVSVMMNQTTELISYSRTQMAPGLDVMAQSGLFVVREGQQLIMTANNTLYSDDPGVQTSWLGVRLDNIMSPFVGISIAGSIAVSQQMNPNH
jgi:hypothetical protein